MANINTQTIRVDLSTDKMAPTAFTHQNDTARTLEFSMYNKGVPYTMTGNTVKFAYKSPIVNGQYSVIAGASMASGTVSGNKVSVTLPIAYTAISGVGMLTMIITPTSGTVRPVNTRLVVQKSADGDDTIAGASDMPDYLAEVAEQYYSQYVTDDVNALQVGLNKIYPFLTADGALYKPLVWEKGSIRDNTNVEVSNNARLRSNYVEVYTNEITLIVGSGFSVYLFEFAADKSFVYEGGWHTGTKIVKLKPTTEYVRIIVKNTDGDSSIVESDGENISAYECSFLTQKEYVINGSEIEWHSGIINKTTGLETDSGTTSYQCTNFIKIPEYVAFDTVRFAAYASNNAASIAFYDSDGEFISAIQRADANPMDTPLPTNASFLKLSTYPSSLATDNAFFSIHIKPIDNLVDVMKDINSLIISEDEVWG